MTSVSSLPNSLSSLPKTSRSSLRQQVERELARRKLLNFTTYTFPGYVPEPAHELIADTLDRVVSGELKKVMIFAPPQHGKSELTSVRLPAYWLGRRPDDPVILASYGGDLAEDKGRQARDLVESEVYQEIYPDIQTSRNSRAGNYWKLAGRRGSMLTAGARGPITGRGGLLGIIDDPFANWEEAQSPTIRQKVWDWYRSTFRTRVWAAGAIVIIMTRWHEDDLAGRLLQAQGDQWFVLRLPAVAETQAERDESNRFLGLPLEQPDPLGRAPGEPLCPIRYSTDALAELRTDVGSMAWYAEYQGVPRAPEGNTFKRSWFEIVNVAPYKAKRVRYWDKAATENGGAYTCGVLWALGDDQIAYIEDVVRGQWSSGEREKIMKQTAAMDAQKYGGNAAVDIWIEQEPGSGGKDSATYTIKGLKGYRVHKEPASGDKLTRAQPMAAYAEAGLIKLVRGVWNQPWLDEITTVPNNTYWDQVDASSGGFNRLVGKSRKVRKGGAVTRRRAGS